MHCTANDVVQTFITSVLPAVDTSPAMVIDPREAVQFAAIADVLLINVGILTGDRVVAMCTAVEHARQTGRSWMLDPVAAGALIVCTVSCHELLALQPVAVRGSASEILALAGMSADRRGVDTTDMTTMALPTAQALAHWLATVVAVTGEVNCVTDDERVLSVAGGSPLMTQVAGTGCTLSAVVVASAALPGDQLEDVATACELMKQAGEVAACQGGPGSFIPAFLDALYQEVQERNVSMP